MHGGRLQSLREIRVATPMDHRTARSRGSCTSAPIDSNAFPNFHNVPIRCPHSIEVYVEENFAWSERECRYSIFSTALGGCMRLWARCQYFNVKKNIVPVGSPSKSLTGTVVPVVPVHFHHCVCHEDTLNMCVLSLITFVLVFLLFRKII